MYIHMHPPSNSSYKVDGHELPTEALGLVRLILLCLPGPRFCSLSLGI